MDIVLAALGGFVLDVLLGDPPWLPWPHPVVVMGRGIAWLEPRLRAAFPATDRGELAAGAALASAIWCGVLPWL